MVDIRVENHGSIYLLTPWADDALAWLREHAPDGAQWWASSLVVEHRYVAAWVKAAIEAGWEVA